VQTGTGAPRFPLASVVTVVPHADLIRAIHASSRQLVIAITGGGSGAISALLEVPGGSRSVLEAVVPYSAAALRSWLGAAPAQFCSAATARAMAMAAFMRARPLAPETDPERLVGVACTASLATDRPKRGEHRIHVAIQSAGETASYELPLEKGRRDRVDEEAVATAVILAAICDACGVDGSPIRAELEHLGLSDQIHVERAIAPAPWRELILGTRRAAIVKPLSHNDHFDESAAPRLPVVFPGAFNPLHVGHLRMAEEAERRLGHAVAWELSVANVDKSPLDFLSLRERIALVRGADSQRLIAITYAPTFREKARLFPQATFVVGADTMVRIADVRYYGGDAAQRDDAIRRIADRGCRFLVFGRELNGQFQSLGDLALPAALAALCDEVPAADFREDVSSTELRDADGV
jgi:nicotinamide mononucleotide (NMN) deamidase PncC